MNGTTMVVLIVFISVGFGVMYDMYKKHLEFKEKTLKHNLSSDAQTQELQQTITDLKRRVAALETIVTDKNYSLKDEINRL